VRRPADELDWTSNLKHGVTASTSRRDLIHDVSKAQGETTEAVGQAVSALILAQLVGDWAEVGEPP
jgi:hypothetical protein